MESYSYTVQNSSPIANIISLILCVIAIAGAWKVFVKAGIPGWHSLIPILNTYDPQQAEEAGHRMVMLLVRMDMHRVSFIREPSERIAAALRKSVQELMQLPANERGRM